MQNTMRISFTALIMLLTNLLLAQTTATFWSDISEDRIFLPERLERRMSATTYRTVAFDLNTFKKALREVPMEYDPAARQQPLRISLPLPNGRTEVFAVVESSVMMPGLAARYPDIKTFSGKSIHNQGLTARFSYSLWGLHAVIHTPQGTVLIEPYANEETAYYQVYYSQHELRTGIPERLSCGHTTAEHEQARDVTYFGKNRLELRSNEALSLRTYRMGIATSGEFARQFNANSKAAVMGLVVNILNRINSVFERDVAIRFVIAENSDSLFFLNPETDPFDNGSNVGQVYGRTPSLLNEVLGINNYDVGHSIIAGCGGGTVGIGGGRACNNNTTSGNFKGFGASCIFNINSSSIEIMAHELGHQFTAQHTWSNCPGSEGQFASASAFEPGGGSTIMSYSGACGSSNIVNSSNDYFHVKSLEEILEYSRTSIGATCGVETPTTNMPPVLTLPYQNGFHIPISTPFELRAMATDANGDQLTYCWEQFDLGPSTPPGSPLLDAPTFRSFPPVFSPVRTFPSINFIVSNTPTSAEVLPTYTRNLTFRCTVRDNNPQAGASVWREVRFRATNTAGPFVVTLPNAADVKWEAGTYQPVRWDVANTNTGLVNCKLINIRLSTDGGFTYPIMLASNVPNNGEAIVPVPDLVSNRARVRVEAADNIFFDISNNNFEILPATQARFTLNATPRLSNGLCLPANAQFRIMPGAVLGYDSLLTLSLQGALPADAIVTFSKNPIAPNDTATLRITFGQQVSQLFNLQLVATSPGGISTQLPIQLRTVSNDFSALQMLTPADGTSGIGLSASFSWTNLPNADAYEFELATSPAFGESVVHRAMVTSATFQPQVILTQNSLYFWRIRPINECGSGAFLLPKTFHTSNVQCQETVNNTRVNISGTGLPTVNSPINIPIQGVINDVNIPFIRATYQPVRSLRVSLVSPAGTEVILFDQQCGGTQRFETGFDDDSPLGITCPPDTRVVVRPQQQLSRFNGENTAGIWNLRFRVMTAGFGGGGAIEEWRIEFCSAISPNNPFIVKNDTLFVPPGRTNTFTSNQLEVQDTDNTPAQLRYTLVTLPVHGVLQLGDAPLSIGSQFTQQEVNNFRLKYTHDSSPSVNDGFFFVVQDGTGGFLPLQYFNIRIDENAPVSTNNLLNINNITVFPNPTRDLLNVRFTQMPAGALHFSLHSAQGQEVLRNRYDQRDQQAQLHVGHLPNGIYFLTVRSADGIFTQKVAIQR